MSDDTDNGPKAAGMKRFGLIWVGQLISLLGSGLTRFALGIWIKRSATARAETVIACPVRAG